MPRRCLAVAYAFLTVEQVARYGRYSQAPSGRQLERFFHFDDRNRELIAAHRGDHNRLGFAVQLATVRFLGTFLPRPSEVPPVVARAVAGEIVVTDSKGLGRYARREQTHREHAREIRRAYGYRAFSPACTRSSSPAPYGTPLVLLDGLLELEPPGAGGQTVITTDQASYSDQVFGHFWLLGSQFSPRSAALPDQRSGAWTAPPTTGRSTAWRATGSTRDRSLPTGRTPLRIAYSLTTVGVTPVVTGPRVLVHRV